MSNSVAAASAGQFLLTGTLAATTVLPLAGAIGLWRHAQMLNSLPGEMVRANQATLYYCGAAAALGVGEALCATLVGRLWGEDRLSRGWRWMGLATAAAALLAAAGAVS